MLGIQVFNRELSADAACLLVTEGPSMSNLFLRPYVPGFRIRPWDGTPGFNIDENNVALLGTGTSYDAQAEPASLAALPGFRVGQRDDIPGFNLNERGVPPQETTWSGGTLPPPRGVEDAGESTPPQLPEWLSTLLAMPLPPMSTAFDPRTGQLIVPYARYAPLINRANAYRATPTPADMPIDYDETRLSSNESWSADPWPGYDLPEQPADIDARSSASTATISSPRTVEQVFENSSLLPLKGRQHYTKVGVVPLGYSPGAGTRGPLEVPPSLRPVANPNFVLANTPDADMQPPEQQRPLTQDPLTQQKIPVTSLAQPAPMSAPPPGFPQRPLKEISTLERSHDEDLAPFIEVYRKAAADVAQDLSDTFARAGKRFYEDSILKAGSDIRRLAEKFVEDPIETTLWVLNSFPQTRVRGEFLAGFAAVFAILANAARGLAFEAAVLAALKAAKNSTKIGVKGQRRSIPDILNEGVTEIKSGLEIDNSIQLKVQAAYAKITGVSFNLVVSPTTKRVSQSIRDAIFATGGTIQRFDPATGTFAPFQ